MIPGHLLSVWGRFHLKRWPQLSGASILSHLNVMALQWMLMLSGLMMMMMINIIMIIIMIMVLFMQVMMMIGWRCDVLFCGRWPLPALQLRHGTSMTPDTRNDTWTFQQTIRSAIPMDRFWNTWTSFQMSRHLFWILRALLLVDHSHYYCYYYYY